MGVTLRHEGGKIYRVDISGRLAKRDFDAVQQSVAAEIGKHGAVRLLIALDGFAGWEPGANWNDLNFYIRYGDDIERIAIVGDEAWRSEALMFAAADLRRGPVLFFPRGKDREAQTWLSA
jgi:stage II sporulation SpoAA-like protein